MPGSPFNLGITVYDTDGSTVMSDVKVTVRNENTNETQSGNTNSSGEIIFNLADFTSGWTVGDKITYFTLYQGYEASGTFTSTDTGGTTKTLTLVALATTPTLRYFTVQEFLDTFELSSYDEDNENGIKAQTIVKVGEMIEKEVDRLLYQTWDDNSGDYYSVSDEYHNVTYKQRIWFLDNSPISSITRAEVNEVSPGDKEEWYNIMYSQLDSCDATTDWSASTDGAVTLNTTNDEFNEGTGCLNITKSGGTQDNVTFSKTLSSTYDFTRSRFKLDFYCEDVSELTTSDAVEIRIGSDSSNYYYFKFDKGEIGEGDWNTLTLDYDSDDSDAGTTGTPDADACDYVAIKITYAASTTTVTAGDMRLDHIRFNNKEDLNIDYDIGRVEITQGSDYNPESGKDQIRFTYKYGTSSVPSDIKRLAILMTARAFGSQALQRLNIDVTEASGLATAIQNLTNFDSEIDRIIQNRKLPPIESIWK